MRILSTYTGNPSVTDAPTCCPSATRNVTLRPSYRYTFVISSYVHIAVIRSSYCYTFILPLHIQHTVVRSCHRYTFTLPLYVHFIFICCILTHSINNHNITGALFALHEPGNEITIYPRSSAGTSPTSAVTRTLRRPCAT